MRTHSLSSHRRVWQQVQASAGRSGGHLQAREVPNLNAARGREHQERLPNILALLPFFPGVGLNAYWWHWDPNSWVQSNGLSVVTRSCPLPAPCIPSESLGLLLGLVQNLPDAALMQSSTHNAHPTPSWLHPHRACRPCCQKTSSARSRGRI